ncbi:MAG: class I SAM-dependent methyltransferase [Spirochaetota bacterium]
MDDLDYQVEIFVNRLKKRAKHLGKWARRNDITCYRLYDADIPEVPLVVDIYANYLHVAEYHAPHKDLPGPPELYQERMLDAARRALVVKEDHAFYKTRRRTARGEQYERLGSESVTATVAEGGLKFVINLSDYLDTGLFLDHRITRSMVRDIASELREGGPVQMLNLFSYTASFSVYAAHAGAKTTSVDLSNTYTAWAKENFAVNGFRTEEHEFITMDVFAFLDAERSRKARYDLIVVDPPTFSNSKKMDRILDVQRDHGELLTRCSQLLSPGGFLVFSTNKRRFRLTEVPSVLDVTDITAQTIPQDFRNQRIHHAYLAERSRS